MKRFLVGLGLLAAIVIPGSSAVAAPADKVVFIECYTEQNGQIVFWHTAPANEMPVQQARAAFDLLLANLEDSCIPGTLESSVRPAAG